MYQCPYCKNDLSILVLPQKNPKAMLSEANSTVVFYDKSIFINESTASSCNNLNTVNSSNFETEVTNGGYNYKNITISVKVVLYFICFNFLLLLFHSTGKEHPSVLDLSGSIQSLDSIMDGSELPIIMEDEPVDIQLMGMLQSNIIIFVSICVS